MSVNWTLENTAVTGETQWTTARYNLSFVLLDNITGQTDFLEVSWIYIRYY